MKRFVEDINRIINGDYGMENADVIAEAVDADDGVSDEEHPEKNDVVGLSLIDKLNMIIEGEEIPEVKTGDDELDEEVHGRERELYDAIMMIAENDGDSYRKRDAKGAAEKACKEYIKSETESLKDDIDSVKSEITRDLAKKWRKKS